MKIRSLSKLAVFFTVTAALTFTSISAHPRSCHRRILRAVERTSEFKDNVETVAIAFHNIYALLNQDYAYLGATPNPNPITNGAVTGLLVTSQNQANEAITRFKDSLIQLRVSADQANLLETQFQAYYKTAINYARVVNVYNVFGSIPDQTGLDPALDVLVGNQDTAAAALLAAATLFGQTIDHLFSRADVANSLIETATLLTEAAQAFRGVLDDSNVYGATPAFPATETTAAMKIFDIIHGIVSQG